MRTRVLFASLLLCCFSVQASEERLSTYRLSLTDSDTLQRVTRYFSVEGRRAGFTEVTVPESQMELFRLLAPRAELVALNSVATARETLARHRLLSPTARYHSFEEVQSWMRDLAARLPALARVEEYGRSGAGRPLLALRLREGEGQRPTVMLTAATHGDELITTETLIGLVEELVNGYGRDPRLTQILRRLELVIVPVVNPDGFTATRRYDGMADPNRSYPYPGHESASPTPSIAGIIRLFEQARPAGSIDFHAYGELIMYPWAYTRELVPEPARGRFDALTRRMAETNRYTYGPISRVIYVAPGSSADYYFWKSGSLSLGIEVGDDKIPDPREIPAYVRAQAESTWRFLESF